MDKQFAFAVVLIILGIGITQVNPDDPFFSGLGYGTVTMAAVWIVFRIVKDLKK
ncbi:MAG: hypothetical protein OXC46_06610 [Thaumarchaeota archaeon]|nr:hypothetical protein [Nitrososphaerota archaeon]